MRRSAPFRDELLSSWISRPAETNYCSVPEFCGYLRLAQERPPEMPTNLAGVDIDRLGELTSLRVCDSQAHSKSCPRPDLQAGCARLPLAGAGRVSWPSDPWSPGSRRLYGPVERPVCTATEGVGSPSRERAPGARPSVANPGEVPTRQRRSHRRRVRNRRQPVDDLRLRL